MKYNVKKLLSAGITGICDSLENVGFKDPEIVDNKRIVLKAKTGTLILDISKTDIKIGDISLDMYFRNIEYKKEGCKTFLDYYLKCNKGIFGDAKTDNYDLIEKWCNDRKEKILAIGENIYNYNGVYFEIINLKDLEEIVYDLIRENRPKKSDVDEMVYTAYMELKRSAENFEPHRYFAYKNKVGLAFNDGTLYITKEKVWFEKTHKIEDKLFFKFNVDFQSLPESNGIVEKWFDVKFNKDANSGKDDSYFVKACLGDLFVTTSYSQVMMYIYGAGGTGKSLLQDTISSILNRKATSSVNINDIGDSFKTSPLFNSVINFSSEISRKEVKASRFKSLIARDEETLSIKFKQDCKGRPLAKWFSVANTIPTIDMDSGVDRRLLPVKMKDTFIDEHNGVTLSGKDSFKQMFIADQKGLINVIVEGILACMQFGFDLNYIYDEFVDNNYKKEIVSYNDAVAYFLEIALERGKEHQGIHKDDLFDSWNEFLALPEGIGISKMKAQTFKAKVNELGINDKRIERKKEGKREVSGRYYKGWRFKNSFLKKVNKANCYTCFDEIMFKEYKNCVEKFGSDLNEE